MVWKASLYLQKNIKGHMKIVLLEFKPFPGHARGTILRMLKKSYVSLPGIGRDLLKKRESSWVSYDNEVFDNPETVGKSGFITYDKKTIVGFASWDPRLRPRAIIGHNCILPAFRGKGFGKQQIVETLWRLQNLGFTSAAVSTGDSQAFIPTRKMYLSCGFHECGRSVNREFPDLGMIEYQLSFTDTGDSELYDLLKRGLS
jgi:GNAT superfamily N-acetyltransferase